VDDGWLVIVQVVHSECRIGGEAQQQRRIDLIAFPQAHDRVSAATSWVWQQHQQEQEQQQYLNGFVSQYIAQATTLHELSDDTQRVVGWVVTAPKEQYDVRMA